MPKKAKKGKKKKADNSEPQHHSSWEKTVETGMWELPVTFLPDANTWPTWGALRERVLNACREIRITGTPSLRDALVSELVELSPPGLTLLNFSGSSNLTKVVISPLTCCTKLADLDLSACASLDYVLIQSNSLLALNLRGCRNLSKALIHCPNLQTLQMTDCTEVQTIMLWSGVLKELDLTGCTNIHHLKLHCPALEKPIIPPLIPPPPLAKPTHPALSGMLKENLKEAAIQTAATKEAEAKVMKSDSMIPIVFR